MDDNKPREDGQKCLDHFMQYEKRLTDITTDMVKELNTRPLTVLPVDIVSLGFRLALTFRLANNVYCPIAILQTTESLKAIIEEVHQVDEFKIVSQDKVPGFIEFNKGTLWKSLR